MLSRITLFRVTTFSRYNVIDLTDPYFRLYSSQDYVFLMVVSAVDLISSHPPSLFSSFFHPYKINDFVLLLLRMFKSILPEYEHPVKILKKKKKDIAKTATWYVPADAVVKTSP
ncbi:uncharacterized protein V6R79_004973 [Siganus canaliculatus]